MRFYWMVLLWLICAPSLARLPETPQFRQHTVADGLPSSTLYGITQDKKGFLWIATKDGLARYDGVGYKIYRYSPGDDNSLPGDVVQALHVDAKDQLWVSTEGQGLSRFDIDRNNLTHFRKSTHPEMASDDIWAITSAPNGDLWFGGYGGGLNRMDKAGRIQRFVSDPQRPNTLIDNIILSLSFDKKGRLWVGTTKGVCVWDGKRFTDMGTDPTLESYAWQLLHDADGTVWVGTRKGLLHMSAEGEKIGDTILPGKIITGLWQDKQAAIWFSDGPNVFQLRDHKLLKYTPNKQVPAKIFGIFEDHEGGFWFPTEDQGLLRLPAGWRNFSVFQHDPYNENSLSGEFIRYAVEADPGHAWLVSKDGGLDKINLETGIVSRMLSSRGIWAKRFWAVAETRDNAVWIGHSDGMTRIDARIGTIKQFKNGRAPQDTLPGPVNLMIQARDGLLWSSSYGGGIQARSETGRVIHRITPDDNKGLQSPDPDQFAISPEGNLWVATAQGMLRWDDDAERFFLVEGSPRLRIDAFSFVNAEIVWIHQIGVLEAFEWDGKRLKSFRRVSAHDGLPPVEVGSILPDRSGNLWLTTKRGLLRYNPLINNFRLYSVRDGLPSQEFDVQPALVTSDGLMIASTINGLVAFDPAKIRKKNTPLTLASVAISIKRQDEEIEFSSASTTVQQRFDDRDLKIILRLLSFVDAPSHRYQFLLKGFDDDWVDVGSSGERVFSSLPPGTYELEAKAADADGRWSEPLKLKIIVHPPWWLTTWAKLLWLLLFLGALWLMAWLYRRRLKLRHAQRLSDQERIIAQEHSMAKSRFLATLGHEIRTPMTGVLGMTELLQGGDLNQQQRHRVNSIQTAGQHLLRLVNDVLDLSQIEAGKLGLLNEVFDVTALMQDVSDLLKPLADIKTLGFECVAEKSAPAYCHGDVGRIRQMLLNLGSNAIKFTERGHVYIRCSGLEPKGLQFQISDTGPGMSEEQQARLFQRFEQAEGTRTNQRYGGSGLGLAICQELAHAMNGHVAVSSQLGHGASFIVELPLDNAEKMVSEKIETKAENKENISTEHILKILLVEDEPIVAEVIQNLLSDMGHEVTHALQGLQALSELGTQVFDLALLDLDLPGLDGFELARLIQAKGYSLPLVAITARADAQAETMALASGMQAFLRKPINGSGLENVLKSLAPMGLAG
jgi:signal transduction histidine kinase/ligand-binding sensor domain-containing protein/CheY-like chemotaxis protein